MLAIGLGAVLFGFLSGFALRGSGPQISTTGPPQDAFLGAQARDDLLFRISSDLPSLMETATLDYDDGDVLDQAHVGNGELTYRPRDLSEGTHTLDFSIDQPFVPWPVRRSWTFTVDTDRPDITITGPTHPAVRGAPVTLSGTVNEPAQVTVDDSEVKVAQNGTFSVTFPTPPSAAVTVRATDRAGNVRGVRTEIPIAPREPMVPTRAVHMTAISWNTDFLRKPVLAMLRAGDINTIELDLKDESGVIGYDSTIPLAKKIGAVKPEYEIRDAVKQIHDLGGRVIGRIVAFRDPVLARYAWDHGDREQVIQAPGGSAYKGYGGFTNFADPVVRQYNIDVATEAARLGVDDILYDYVRRPDGPLDTMVFPGLKGGAQASIVSFLGDARKALDPTGAFLGASLFGIAADRPEEVAQNVPADRAQRGLRRAPDLPVPLGPRRLRGRRCPSASRARSSRSPWSASTSWWRAAAPASCPGSRTSPSRSTTGPRRSAPRSTAPRPRACTSGSCGTPWSPTPGRPASSSRRRRGGPHQHHRRPGPLQEGLDLGAHAVPRLAADLQHQHVEALPLERAEHPLRERPGPQQPRVEHRRSAPGALARVQHGAGVGHGPVEARVQGLGVGHHDDRRQDHLAGRAGEPQCDVEGGLG